MATIVTRAGKGSPLTHEEVDANFTNLNDEAATKAPLANPVFTGNVGIGTASPDFPLDVSSTGVGSTIVSRFYVTDNTVGLLRVGNSTTGDGATAPAFGANATSAVIYTNNTERMRIDASGNVGIGTTDPQTKLEISSNNTAGTALNILRFNDADTSTVADQETGKIEFYVNDASVGGTGVASFIAGLAAGTSGGGYLNFATSNNGSTGAIERLRIAPNGALGIGGANYGTAGQVLTSNGPVAPSWASVEAVPAGAVAHFAMNTAPTGWLKANGAAVSRTTYATLFAAINTTFGSGDGSTTFNLPDMRGRFTRNWADNGSIDSGRAFGSTQNDALQGHRHNLRASNGYQVGWDGGGGAGSANLRADNSPTTPYGEAWELITDGTNGTPRTASETRPTNIALLACIKF